ncbi:lysoplasmalogenase [Microcella sp.]|uniref:lysoplasmalogenase n=1 Tax=Microcella sp. TaxID=1913979 RepID=UPI00299F6607|nr:lysoplasmalogenase [Microcella sp.]MDX2025226.1 lysoplasmalogenase [Microcella sp.]
MRPTFRPLPAFTPFIAVTVVHLIAIAAGGDQIVAATKPLLMPALLIALLLGLPARRSILLVWGGLALVFSWLGDVLLQSPGDIGFLIGMGAFGLAHLAYIALYLGPLRTRCAPWWGIAVAALWWIALVTFLAPNLGGLLVPVAVYGLVLGTAAATALGTSRLIATGAGVFLVSDTLLGLDRFLPGFSFGAVDLLIMFTYCLGQGLIIAGVVTVARRRAGFANAGQLVPAASPQELM